MNPSSDDLRHRDAGAVQLSVITPVYGCTDCLEDLVDRIGAVAAALALTHEVILVDDCGPDHPWPRIRELASTRTHVVGVRLSRNFGQHSAISAGLKQSRGEVVVVMDCDLQDVPEEIPKLLGALGHDYDVALGRRTARQDSFLKRGLSAGFYALLSWLTGVRQDPSVANFGAYRRVVVDAINAMPETNRFFPLLVRWTGFRSTSVPVRHSERLSGQSSYSLGRMLRLALDVAIAYSDKPLRITVSVGIVFSMVAALVVIYTLAQYFAGNTAVAGFTSILASIWLVGGVTQVSIGVVGLYLGRVYVETKARPAYLVAEVTTGRDRPGGR